MNDKRIKLKCENGQPVFAIILVTLIFTGAGLGMLFLPVRDFLKTGSLLKVNPGFLALGAVGIFFAGMGMYFFFFLLKPARAYKGTLVEKTLGENGGYHYEFEAVPNPRKESSIPFQYSCSGKENIDLYEGDDCILYLKEATWAATAVESYSPGKKCAPYLMGTTMVPAFLGIGVILLALGLASLTNYLQHNSSILSLVFAILFFVLTVLDVLYAIQFEKDSAIVPKRRTGRGPDVGPETLPEGMGDGQVFYIKQDTGLNVHRKVLIENQYHELVTSLEYPILGGVERILKDRSGNAYGTYTFRFSNLTPSANFELEGYEEFAIRSKMTAVRINIMPDVDYESRGGITTIDSRIIDAEGNVVATMCMVPNEGDLLQWYITKVTMEPGYRNNIYILMLALYTFEDFHARKERR